MFLKKVNLWDPSRFWWPGGVFLFTDNAKLLAEIFSENSNLNGSDSVLLWFCYSINLKLYHVSLIRKIERNIVTALDTSTASGPNCILVVVLKNCASALSCLLADLLSVSKIWFLSQKDGLNYVVKKWLLAILLSVVCKIFQEFVNSLVGHIEKMLSVFQHGFKSFCFTVDSLTVKADRLAWLFKETRSGICLYFICKHIGNYCRMNPYSFKVTVEVSTL